MSEYREPYVALGDECCIQRVFLSYEDGSRVFPPPPGGGWELVSGSAFDKPSFSRTTVILTWRKRPT